MAQSGDKRDCGGYTRIYSTDRWDVITTDEGVCYWRDKKNHITYEQQSSIPELLMMRDLGERVDLFDDEDEDSIWGDDADDSDADDSEIPNVEDDDRDEESSRCPFQSEEEDENDYAPADADNYANVESSSYTQ